MTEVDEIYRNKSILFLESVVEGVEAQNKQNLVYQQLRDQRKSIKILSKMEYSLSNSAEEFNGTNDKFLGELNAFRERIVKEMDTRRQNVTVLRSRQSAIDEEFNKKQKQIMSIDKSIKKLDKRWRKRMFVQLEDVMKTYPLAIGTTFDKWQEGKSGTLFDVFRITFKFLDFASWKEEADEEEMFASDYLVSSSQRNGKR